MQEQDPLKLPCAPLPTCGHPRTEQDFAKLPVDRILDQLMGYSQYPFFAVNELEVPDVYTNARPEAVHTALAELMGQLRDLLPPDHAYVGELACLRCYDYLDALHRSMAPHLFKMGYLFGCAERDWDSIALYTLSAGGET